MDTIFNIRFKPSEEQHDLTKTSLLNLDPQFFFLVLSTRTDLSNKADSVQGGIFSYAITSFIIKSIFHRVKNEVKQLTYILYLPVYP